MRTRTRIVAALQTVPGLQPAESAPDVPAPGSAWPVWTGAAPGTYSTLVDAWWVYTVLPDATLMQTIEAGDALVQNIWAALLDVGDVSACDAATITEADPATAGQALPALRFTMTTATGDRP